MRQAAIPSEKGRARKGGSDVADRGRTIAGWVRFAGQQIESGRAISEQRVVKAALQGPH